MRDLLHAVELEDRFVESPNKDISVIDFALVNKRIQKYSEQSKLKLLHQLIQK